MLERLKAAFSTPPTPDEVTRDRILAIYQRFWHEDGEQNYLTAALLRQDDQWAVVAVDGEFRGAWDFTLHRTLEEARNAIIEWVGEPREVDDRLVSATVWAKLRQVIITGSGDGDGDPY